MQKLNEEQDIEEQKDQNNSNFKQQTSLDVQDTEHGNLNNNYDEEEQNLSQFECIICYDVAKEPVVTKCGHMFCWSCIYKWLNQNQDFLQCPVCKNGITQDTLIPVFTKQDSKHDSHHDPLIPPRPQTIRTNPVRNENVIGEDGNFMNRGQNLQGGIMLAGYGYFPSLFNLQYQVQNVIDDSQEGKNQYSIPFY